MARKRTGDVLDAGGGLADRIARVAAGGPAEPFGENGDEARVALVSLAELQALRRKADTGGDELFDRAARMARVGYWLWDEVADQGLHCSEELGRIFGITPAEYRRSMRSTDDWLAWIHPDDRSEAARAVEKCRAGDGRYDVEYRLLRSDGTILHVREIAEPVFGSAGRLVRTSGIVQDITELRRAEQELRDSEAQLRSIHKQLPGSVYRFVRHPDGSTSYPFISERVKDLLGYSAEEIAADPAMFALNIHPEDQAARERALEASVETLERYDAEYRFVRPDGETIWIRSTAQPEKLEDGTIIWTGLTRDVSARKHLEFELQRAYDTLEMRVRERTEELGQANRALQAEIIERRIAEQATREFGAQLKLITDNIPALIAYVRADETYEFVNRRCCEWYDCAAEEIIGSSIADIHGENYRQFGERLATVRQGNHVEFEDRVHYPDGVTRDIRARFVPHKDRGGVVIGMFSLVEDITELKQVEEQARQAQKMEAVGQLTGGVAHDFNNLLAVIIGNAEILLEDLGSGEPSVGAVLRAARRGVELTQRLLAFSRRQPLDPRPVDLGELAEGMMAMLARTLGGSIDIQVRRPKGLWQAMADAGQVENALLNLAINARDAMPGGGQLVIEGRNVSLGRDGLPPGSELAPGEYAVLAVADTGSGMPQSVIDRAFEPFFTTKEVGQGTGLGLSMIYGFARQSGGHVAIESREGQGTTVTLYLPRARDEATPCTPENISSLPRGNGETVLLLEDDDDVRMLVSRLLEGLGYRVLQAGQADDAAGMMAAARNVDLLLSDVVLPGRMNGPEFAARARAERPGLKVVFISGYPAEAQRRDRIVDLGGAPLLSKPIDRRHLAETLRAILQG